MQKIKQLFRHSEFYESLLPPQSTKEEEEHRQAQEEAAKALEEQQAKQTSQSKIYAPKTGSYLESFKLK